MSDPDLGDFDAWHEKYPTPATPEQLEKLAALYGLKLSHREAFSDAAPDDADDYFTMCTSNDDHVLMYYATSPIERYIARIAQWRRGRK